MEITVYIIDTFTSEAFRGNPTGVCYMPGPVSEEAFQSIAAELNFPVTAFIGPVSSVGWGIDYFTPVTRIPACGHATLAAARVVFDEEAMRELTFYTAEKISIKVRLEDDLITMTYPRFDLKPTPVNEKMLESLGIDSYLSAGICTELESLFIELEDPRVLRNIRPDFNLLMAVMPDIKEVVVTSVSDKAEYDFLLRSFCPWIGIDEDPVTGSVHAVLAHFWQQRLHKRTLKAWQCSERGGELYVKAFDDKVELGGKTVTLLKGTMTLSDE